MGERNVVIIADDSLARAPEIARAIRKVDSQWRPRRAPLADLLRSLTSDEPLVDIDGDPVAWDDVATVITDTVDRSEQRGPLAMLHTGLEVAMRLTHREAHDISVIGYSGLAAENPTIRIAWAVAGRPLVPDVCITQDPQALSLLLYGYVGEDDPVPLQHPAEADWASVHLHPPSEGTDPEAVHEAVWLALTEANRRRDARERRTLWRMIAEGPTGTDREMNSAADWARNNVGPLLGPAPAGGWSFPAIRRTIRLICGFPAHITRSRTIREAEKR